jgi:hypothetical protein
VRASGVEHAPQDVLAAARSWPRQLGDVAELDAVTGGRDVEVEQPRKRQGDEQEVAAEVGIGQHLHDPAVSCIAGCVVIATASGRSWCAGSAGVGGEVE